MEHSRDHSHCHCNLTSANDSVRQTLPEMEWERGIWNAALSGDYEKVQHLIDKANNARALVNTPDNSGYVALHYAARNGHLEICKMLIKNGAQVNAETRSGKATPLHKASVTGNIATLKLLLEHGAKAELQDADGKTVLHKAVENKHYDLVEFLLEEFPVLHDIKDNKGNIAVRSE